jgi:hypothetical protein
LQAGLFSAVTSAFIIQVHPQLQQDPNDVTAALLRVLIYTMNNTAVDGIPTAPPWTGPPLSLVQVQALLYASLAASLLSALLAMLGKQWLNRYASIEMRGSAIERSQNRQLKLNGIFAWCFDYVMESLPLMLQIALLLLGCALSKYLQDINVTIASVVLGVTTFGLTLYVFVVVAGTIFTSCPYQTPGAQALRFLWQKVSKFFAAKFLTASQSETQPGPAQVLDGEVTILDFRCISWMLRTSLDRTINELTLKFLESVLSHPGCGDGIVADCLNVLISCVSIADGGRMAVIRGSERLAEMGAMCLLRALSHRLIEQPLSNIPRDLYQRYKSVFRSTEMLSDLPFYHTIAAVHRLITSDSPGHLNWDDIDPSTPESRLLAHNLVKIAWYQKNFGLENQNDVDPWILRFSYPYPSRLLSNPEPPMPVIADCLSITAIGLGCNVSRDYVMDQDKRYVL